MKKVLIFGGTAEGVLLAEKLPAMGWEVTLSVATKYGALMLRELPVRVLAGRLDRDGMVKLLREGGFSQVIDATHPYAVEVSANLAAAAAAVGLRPLRLLRPAGETEPDWRLVPSPHAAADELNRVEGNLLLTTGSKDLAAFTAVRDYQKRLWIRVLPSVASLNAAFSLGYPPDHIIAMHGPFSEELNLALLRQFAIRAVVSKRSGSRGGFWEKASAARKAGALFVVIDRPVREAGLSLEEVLSRLERGEIT